MGRETMRMLRWTIGKEQEGKERGVFIVRKYMYVSAFLGVRCPEGAESALLLGIFMSNIYVYIYIYSESLPSILFQGVAHYVLYITFIQIDWVYCSTGVYNRSWRCTGTETSSIYQLIKILIEHSFSSHIFISFNTNLHLIVHSSWNDVPHNLQERNWTRFVGHSCCSFHHSHKELLIMYWCGRVWGVQF